MLLWTLLQVCCKHNTSTSWAVPSNEHLCLDAASVMHHVHPASCCCVQRAGSTDLKCNQPGLWPNSLLFAPARLVCFPSFCLRPAVLDASLNHLICRLFPSWAPASSLFHDSMSRIHSAGTPTALNDITWSCCMQHR